MSRPAPPAPWMFHLVAGKVASCSCEDTRNCHANVGGRISWLSVLVVVEQIMKGGSVDQLMATRCCLLVVLNLKVWCRYGSYPQKMDVHFQQKMVSLHGFTPCSSTEIREDDTNQWRSKKSGPVSVLVARIWVDRIALVGFDFELRRWFDRRQRFQCPFVSQPAFSRIVTVTGSPLIYPSSPFEGIRV